MQGTNKIAKFNFAVTLFLRKINNTDMEVP